MNFQSQDVFAFILLAGPSGKVRQPEVNEEDLNDEFDEEEELMDRHDDDNAGSDVEAIVSEDEADYYPGM